MTEEQLAFFEKKLMETLRELDDATPGINIEREGSTGWRGDEADVAERVVTGLMDNALSRRRAQMRREILAALERIRDGSYGYCEDTGEEIGFERLMVNPVARYSVEAQQKRELMHKLYSRC